MSFPFFYIAASLILLFHLSSLISALCWLSCSTTSISLSQVFSLKCSAYAPWAISLTSASSRSFPSSVITRDQVCKDSPLQNGIVTSQTPGAMLSRRRFRNLEETEEESSCCGRRPPVCCLPHLQPVLPARHIWGSEQAPWKCSQGLSHASQHLRLSLQSDFHFFLRNLSVSPGNLSHSLWFRPTVEKGFLLVLLRIKFLCQPSLLQTIYPKVWVGRGRSDPNKTPDWGLL